MGKRVKGLKNLQGVRANAALPNAEDDPRIGFVDEKKFRFPVGLVIIAVWAVFVLLVMNVRTFVKTGGNEPVNEAAQNSQPK